MNFNVSYTCAKSKHQHLAEITEDQMEQSLWKANLLAAKHLLFLTTAVCNIDLYSVLQIHHFSYPPVQ